MRSLRSHFIAVLGLALLGPVVSLNAAERIVTLGASVTEMVFALGAGAEVVGRDTSSRYPKETFSLPDVGYFRTISAEGVLAQKPTVIIADTGTGPAQQVELLRKSGARFVYLKARPSADSAVALIEEVGAAIGRVNEAKKLSARLREQLAAASALAKASGKTPRVVFILGMSGGALQAAGDGTAAAGLIGLAGGENALSGFSGYKSVTAEAVLASDPDFILFAETLHGGGTALSLEDPPAWLAASRAMRAGHVKGIDMTYHLVFGPRLGEAVTEVTKMLHPAP